MKKYKNILIALSLLSFAACGSSGGGSNNVKPSISPETTKLINSEITKNKSPMIETTGKTISNTKNDIITLTKDNFPTRKDKNGKIDYTYFGGEVARGQNSTVINNGIITSKGISKENKDGTGTYDQGIGMLAEEKGKVINNGTINGRLRIGMESLGSESSSINRGTINLSGRESYSYTDTDGILYNVKDENSYGMLAETGATALNDTNGKILGGMTKGMESIHSDSKITNYGEITLTSPKYLETYTDENGIKQENKDTTYYGMYSESSSSSENQGKIEINGKNGYGIGMYSVSSTLINGNEGIISGDNLSIGMSGENSLTVENSGIINISGNVEGGLGIYGENSNITNTKTGKIIGSSLKVGIYSKGNSSTNEGLINISGNTKDGLGIYGENSNITNKKTGKIIGSSLMTGIYSNGSSSTNEGLINISGNVEGASGIYGVKTEAGSSFNLINEESGIIEGKNLTLGMYKEGEGTLQNKGIIKIIKGDYISNGYSIGMLGAEDSKIRNDGFIILDIKDDRKLVNLEDKLAIGMAMSIEEENGNWDQNNGMVNNEKIILKDNSIGMGIENEENYLQGEERVATNNGDIYLNGHDSIGMAARGNNTKIINNETGTIHLSGASLDGNGDIDAIADSRQDASGVNEFGKDNHGNIAMKIENGATMVNKGKIIFEGK